MFLFWLKFNPSPPPPLAYNFETVYVLGADALLRNILCTFCLCSFLYIFIVPRYQFQLQGLMLFLGEIDLLLMLFLLTCIVPWYKTMKILFICPLSKQKKTPNSILSQIQNHQSQCVGQTLDTCIQSPLRLPHMKQSPGHLGRFPPKLAMTHPFNKPLPSQLQVFFELIFFKR